MTLLPCGKWRSGETVLAPVGIHQLTYLRTYVSYLLAYVSNHYLRTYVCMYVQVSTYRTYTYLACLLTYLLLIIP
jgi:hypothetical protein